MKRRNRDVGSLADDLEGLPNLDRTALVSRWQSLYGTQPPAKIGTAFLLHAIAYRMQEEMIGGLKPATHRYLAKVVRDASEGAKITAPPTTIKPGTRLLREWHGITHEVIIQADGVSWGGKQYRSLSEVARAITGTRWSGPLFFGLKKGAAA